MRSLEPFEQHLAARWPPPAWSDFTVVLAVSGGADSVALLRAMAAIQSGGTGRLVVAHFDHRLRGADSEADSRFVVELCRQLALECVVGQADTPPSGQHPDGLEAAARDARYRFLRETAEALGARYVATAHTLDDQAETVLHHVLRGTGLAGLAGMSRTRPLGPAVTLIRPLLAVRRGEVLEYLAALDQPYREDRTNVDTQFTRNRIRRELLPQLARDYSPGVVDALVRLAAVAADAQHLIDTLTDPLVERAVDDRAASHVAIDCRALAGKDRHLVRELFVHVWRRRGWPLQAMGYAEWNALADMALAAVPDGSSQAPDAPRPTKRVLPGAVTAEMQGEQLVLRAAERA